MQWLRARHRTAPTFSCSAWRLFPNLGDALAGPGGSRGNRASQSQILKPTKPNHQPTKPNQPNQPTKPTKPTNTQRATNTSKQECNTAIRKPQVATDCLDSSFFGLGLGFSNLGCSRLGFPHMGNLCHVICCEVRRHQLHRGSLQGRALAHARMVSGCHWLPLAAIGCHWLPLAAIDGERKFRRGVHFSQF